MKFSYRLTKFPVVGTVLIAGLLVGANAYAITQDQAEARAAKLYRLLNNGLPLAPSNPLHDGLVSAMLAGNVKAAVSMITDPKSGSPTFYNNAIASLPQTINRDGTAAGNRNELSAMFLGYARDGFKFSEMFYADRIYFDPNIQTPGYRYQDSPSAHFQQEWMVQNPRDGLQANPRPTSPAVGLFTSSVWGLNYFNMGTNRRNWGIGIMQDLYCINQNSIKSLVIPDTYVATDVPRTPGGDASQYLKNCKGCHAQMDAIRPAFLAYDWNGSSVVKLSPVVDKINDKGVYPSGFIPTTDDWHLFVTPDQNAIFGFQAVDGLTFQNYGPNVQVMNGKGLDQFGKVIGNSLGLYNCMVRRIVSQVYMGRVYGLIALSADDQALLHAQDDVIANFAAQFQQHQNLRKAYEDIAVYYLDAIQE